MTTPTRDHTHADLTELIAALAENNRVSAESNRVNAELAAALKPLGEQAPTLIEIAQVWTAGRTMGSVAKSLSGIIIAVAGAIAIVASFIHGHLPNIGQQTPPHP
ncbi:MAG: hypothetical protein KGJ57_17365 [Sphingomonadales bacterium]|nr:hypothetical protein [Sphingomonadales bacterium]MDE2171167.1 hypothetical protein [Sphingomonadales bacterium]